MKCALAGAVSLLMTTPVFADDGVTVPDASQLSWQADPTGKVWIRNLNQFDSTFLGCCYNFYIDTTTPDGKTKWSAFLAYALTGGHLYFFVPNKTQPGPITYVGNIGF